jgi:predicted nucleic acid-binding protein
MAGRAEATAVLDTSVVIDSAAGRIDPEAVPERVWITTVTLGELSVGPLTATTEEERVARLAVLQAIESQFAASTVPYDVAAARAYGRVVADVRRVGRQPRRRTADLMIAAIALSRDVAVCTTNADDFGGISGLRVVALTAR